MFKQNYLINIQSSNDYFLFLCSVNNIIEITKMLEDKEVNINYQDINGSTGLHFAVKNKFFNLVKLLIDFGADPNIQQSYEIGYNSSVHFSVIINDPEILKILIYNNGNIHLKNKYGFTPLHIACKEGFINIVKKCIELGSDVNVQDFSGYNPSMWANINNHLEILDLLPPPKHYTIKEIGEWRNNMHKVYEIKNNKKGKKGIRKKK